MNDTQAAVLAEILAEPVRDSALALPVIDIEPKPKKTAPRLLTVSGLGGRHVVVDEDNFGRLVEAAGLVVHGDVSHADFGALVSTAKDTDSLSLLGVLLTVRCAVSPLYRIRTQEGRPWFSRPRPVLPIVNETPIEQEGALAL